MRDTQSLLVNLAVSEFLFAESAALDEARHDEWLDMLSEDFVDLLNS